jgi:hypothetical protein
MRAAAIRLTLGWLVVAAWCAAARGDGGTLRSSQRAGRYEIAVFTAPEPFRAGPVDISVLVQDAGSKEPVPDARVVVGLTPLGRPGGTTLVPATTAAATNKLLRSALFELPGPGRWMVDVDIAGAPGNAHVRFELEAADRLPRWLALWPWLSWPALVVLLYGIHQFFTFRKSRSATREPADPAPAASI